MKNLKIKLEDGWVNVEPKNGVEFTLGDVVKHINLAGYDFDKCTCSPTLDGTIVVCYKHNPIAEIEK